MLFFSAGSIGAKINNTKHWQHEGLLDCFFSRKQPVCISPHDVAGKWRWVQRSCYWWGNKPQSWTNFRNVLFIAHIRRCWTFLGSLFHHSCSGTHKDHRNAPVLNYYHREKNKRFRFMWESFEQNNSEVEVKKEKKKSGGRQRQSDSGVPVLLWENITQFWSFFLKILKQHKESIKQQ